MDSSVPLLPGSVIIIISVARLMIIVEVGVVINIIILTTGFGVSGIGSVWAESVVITWVVGIVMRPLCVRYIGGSHIGVIYVGGSHIGGMNIGGMSDVITAVCIQWLI